MALATGSEASGMVLLQVEVLVAYSPLLGPLLGASALRWLLRPYSLSSLGRGQLPRHERRRVLAMAMTVLLPLGGMLVPWWIYLHHRCWPRQQLPAMAQSKRSPARY
jgi:hypothetical protein